MVEVRQSLTSHGHLKTHSPPWRFYYYTLISMTALPARMASSPRGGCASDTRQATARQCPSSRNGRQWRGTCSTWRWAGWIHLGADKREGISIPGNFQPNSGSGFGICLRYLLSRCYAHDSAGRCRVMPKETDTMYGVGVMDASLKPFSERQRIFRVDSILSTLRQCKLLSIPSGRLSVRN